MVNPDSGLFRAHPGYAVRAPDRKPVLGRHQLVLDLCQSEVRDYIVENVGRCSTRRPAYVKWDIEPPYRGGYSPALSNQGEFYHRYIMGLYEVLRAHLRPETAHPARKLLERGQPVRPGMLCFSPQIWTSDDTDPSNG
jgi:alpha-galactosidase